MHNTMPTNPKRTRITLPPLQQWKVKRGHTAHRGGAGTQLDPRTKRQRSRGDQ
jgi:hypothetical protein